MMSLLPIFKTRKSGLRRPSFGKDQKGSTAVEFAMVAPLFLGLLFSIFEAGYFYYQQAVIEDVVARAARDIRVGNAPTASYTDTTPGNCQTGKDCFYQSVCQPLSWFGNCADNLAVDVKTFTSFTALNDDLSTTSCPSDTTYDYDNLNYEPGDELAIVRIRSCYLIRTFNPALGMKLTRTEGNRRAVVAVSIVRNEPFGDGAPDITP
jgi:Flp pilus assembly protein TadG